MEKYDVFISYSRKDSKIAQKLIALFKAAGIRYFIDKGMTPGVAFPVELAEGILNSHLFLLLGSKNAYDSTYTISEVTFAKNKKPVETLLLYRIDGSDLPIGLQFLFASNNWCKEPKDDDHSELIADMCRMLGRSVEERDPAVLFQEGLQKYKDNDFTGAFPLFLQAAKSNHSDGQYYLGECYVRGRGTEPDVDEGIRWITRAAKNNCAEAQYQLGRRYQNGFGLEPDQLEALKWFELAANQSHGSAFAELGKCYECGLGVPENYERAKKYYRLASLSGSTEGQFRLGLLYAQGLGVNQNYTTAAKCYHKAAVQGHRDAQYYLALCYDLGFGVEENAVKAVDWYLKAANQDHPEAKERLEELSSAGS